MTKGNTPFAVDLKALKKLRLVGVAYSAVDREMFATEKAYKAEVEVVKRAEEVAEHLREFVPNVILYRADENFVEHITNDNPDLIVNLVDTVRGRDLLQTSVPASLDFFNIPYTGSGMQGLAIGNDRNLFKQIITASGVPTPPYKFIPNSRTKIPDDFPKPIIVKLNESGGSVGIDNNAVKETVEEAEKQVAKLMEKYHIPVIVERFIGGPEITGVIFDDGKKKHIFMAQKVFKNKLQGKYYYTSQESYGHKDTYFYEKVEEELVKKIEPLVLRAFTALKYRDYAKFDIRLGRTSKTPYFIDCNPNTAFGPHIGLPLTEVLDLFNISFDHALRSLVSKHAKEAVRSRMRRIPFQKQISDVHCGPAVVQMLLENLGIRVSQEDITRAAGAEATILEHGTRVDQLAQAVETLAPNVRLYYKDHSTLKDIRKLLNAGYPVAVEWQGIFGEDDESAEDTDGHYSIVSHIDSKKRELIIVDPYKEKVSQFSILAYNNFLNRWWDTNMVTDKKSGKEKLVKDEEFLFIVAREDDEEVKSLGMKEYPKQ